MKTFEELKAVLSQELLEPLQLEQFLRQHGLQLFKRFHASLPALSWCRETAPRLCADLKSLLRVLWQWQSGRLTSPGRLESAPLLGQSPSPRPQYRFEWRWH